MPENIIQIDQNLLETRLDRLITEKMTQILVGDSFWFRFSVGTTGAGGAGNCFSRFPRLGMPSGVTLVN